MTGDRRFERAHDQVAAAPTSGVLRLARGSAVGATAMGLALAGNVAAGGSLPTPTTALGLLGLTVAGSVALSGRRWTVSALLSVLIGVQVAFHVAFGDHPAASGVAAHHHAAHGMSASMVLAHLLAAGAAAMVLRRGESWCWRLVAVLNRPAQVARAFGSRLMPTSPARPVPLVRSRLPLQRSLLLAEAQPRRGPPAPLAR